MSNSYLKAKTISLQLRNNIVSGSIENFVLVYTKKYTVKLVKECYKIVHETTEE